MLTIKQAVPQAEKALALLDSIRKNPEASADQVVEFVGERKAVSIELKNVSFTYPGSVTESLIGINAWIAPGQQVAFIGPSGAGKSTIADLILGLLEPTSGGILVDGRVAKAAIKDFPGSLAYVPQKPGIISGTIAENIALGVPVGEVDSKRLEKAVEDSHLVDVIDSLPKGLNTNLGNRRDELSGGQLQRIGLARALYSQPSLLVMDEATSALDAESENEINIALDAMRGKVTVVLIAHRLNTIQRSDIVFLLEAGQITASGTFPELLKTNKNVQNLSRLMSIDPTNK
jgi:ATP-binding cassette subfamily C protein